jgi:hypothetical protein
MRCSRPTRPEGVKLEIHDVEEKGACSLSGKEGEVLVVTFADGTVSESALSVKFFIQLLKLNLGQKPRAKPPELRRPRSPGTTSRQCSR